MLNVGFSNIYNVLEVNDLATGNILTTTSATYVDVPGISFSFSGAVNGDILVIACGARLLGTGGSQCRAIVTVDENGTLTDVAATERTNDSSATLDYYVMSRYTVAHQPASGGSSNVTIKLRAKRQSGAANAIVASAVNLLTWWTRGR